MSSSFWLKIHCNIFLVAFIKAMTKSIVEKKLDFLKFILDDEVKIELNNKQELKNVAKKIKNNKNKI